MFGTSSNLGMWNAGADDIGGRCFEIPGLCPCSSWPRLEMGGMTSVPDKVGTRNSSRLVQPEASLV